MREFPSVLPDPEYPMEFAVRRVAADGRFSWQNCSVQLGSLLAKQEIGVEEIAACVCQLWFGPVYLELLIDEGKKRISYLKNQLPTAPE